MTNRTSIAAALYFVFILSACSVSPSPAPSSIPTTPILPQASPSNTPSPLPPTATPEPLAARVNDEKITLAEYNASLQRLQSALSELGRSLPADQQRQQVLDDLVAQVLLSQAAERGGFKLSEADFQKRLADTIARAGGQARFSEWLVKNFYTPELFSRDLRRSLAVNWQREQIFNAVPTAAEQVHARQILVPDQATAERYLKLLQAGSEFASLAYQVDPDIGGDLGWFPRGYLTQPELEKIAFELAPGKFSQVIQTTFGYHILMVIEKNPKRLLSQDALQRFQTLALQNFVSEQKGKAAIEILVK